LNKTREDILGAVDALSGRGFVSTILSKIASAERERLADAAEFYLEAEPKSVILFGVTEDKKGGGWKHILLHKIVLRKRTGKPGAVRWKRVTVLPSRRDALASVVARFTDLDEIAAQKFVDACPGFVPAQRIADMASSISRAVRSYDASDYGLQEARDLLAGMEQIRIAKFRASLSEALKTAVAVGMTEEELVSEWRMSIVSSVHEHEGSLF